MSAQMEPSIFSDHLSLDANRAAVTLEDRRVTFVISKAESADATLESHREIVQGLFSFITTLLSIN
jgi:hypothetical protein